MPTRHRAVRRPLARLTVALLIIAVGSSAGALDTRRQLTQYARRSFASSPGAPTGTVNAIAQSSDGYIWIATDTEGLLRFDGVRFVRVDELDGLLPRQGYALLSLLRARDGTLVVGTQWGLVRRTGRGWQFDGATNGWGVHSLAEDAGGTLWLGTTLSGVRRLDGDAYREVPGHQRTNRLLPAAGGGLWVASATGLAFVRSGGGVSFDLRDGLGDPWVGSLAEEPTGGIWVGTRGGLARIESGRVLRNESVRDGLPSSDVRALLVDRDGSLWVGTTGGLARRRAGGGFERLPPDLPPSEADEITALFEDGEGSLWIGTRSGLQQLVDVPFTAIGPPEGLAHPLVASLLPARDGSVWVFSDGGGLNHITQTGIEKLGTQHGLASNFGGPLFEDREGSLWIGHDRGLSRYENGRFTTHRQPPLGNHYVALVTEDDESLLVFVHEVGLLRYRSGRLERFRLADGSALEMGMPLMAHRSQDGALWFATVEGLVRVHDGRATTVWRPEGIAVATSIHETEDGTLWVGTWDGVLRVRGGRVDPVTPAHGLFHHRIHRLLDDGVGSFWMSCPRGIFRVSRWEMEAVADGKLVRLTSHVYGTSDGMRSLEVTGSAPPAGCVTKDGRLWFPTRAGVVVVDPRRLPQNAMLPSVVIESVKADGRGAELADEGRFPAPVERLEFQFTAPSFAAPERVRFRHRLVGFDAGWVDAADRRAATYTSLPPGRYEFRVSASNGEGAWNDTGSSIEIEQPPYVHQTLSFRFAVAVTLCLLVWGLVKVRLRLARRRYEMILDERNRLASELHDTVEQGLAGARFRVGAAEGRLADTDPMAAEDLAAARRLLDYTRDETRRAVMELRSEALKKGDLGSALGEVAATFGGVGGARIEVETIGEAPRPSPSVEHNLFRIGQEALTNAIKHSGARRIRVTVTHEPAFVTLQVRDDGCGFDTSGADVRTDAYGLRGLKARATALNATAEITSAQGEGTLVAVRCARR